MQQHRTLHIPSQADGFFQGGQIMAVNRAKVVQAHFAEDIIRQHPGFEPLLHLMGGSIDDGQFLHHGTVPLLEADIPGAHSHHLQQAGYAAYVLTDGHIVIVEDDDQRLITGGSIRQTLIGKAPGQSPVANNSDYVILLLIQRPGPGHAQGNGHGIGGVAGNKGIVHRLIGLGKAGEAAVLPQRPERIPAASNNLMGIALVANIKNEPVNGGVIYSVQGHGQLNSA